MTGGRGRDSRMRVLIAGGGVAALEGALALRALAGDLVSVGLIAPDHEFVYRPLAVAEPFRLGEVRTFPLDRVVDEVGARAVPDAIVAVDPDTHTVATEGGAELAYDTLLLALGARPRSAVSGATTFTGPASRGAFQEILDDAASGSVGSIVFAVPAGASWPLPLYELALLTSSWLVDRGTRGVELTVVTPEEAPLALFGTEASTAIRELLEIREIGLRTQITPVEAENGALAVVGRDEIPADRVVALPRLEGPSLKGLWHDVNGFVPTDEHGRVSGEVDVYAAGDMTLFPLKQGGIAAQQADAAAAAIAVAAGADVEATPFRPVLRGLLLTGMVPRFLRAEPGTSASVVDTEPLWRPPGKIVGRYLAPFLAERLGMDQPREGVTVEVALDAQTAAPQAGSPA